MEFRATTVTLLVVVSLYLLVFLLIQRNWMELGLVVVSLVIWMAAAAPSPSDIQER